MVTYIYFVKCPNCEDEHFDFFDEAKEFALSCLSQKPIITQTEVCRNDFGECTDSADLGTVWSWEEAMKDTEGGYTDAEPAKSIFTKDDLKLMADGKDPEFDNLDNSVDFEIDEVSDDPRKSITEASDWNPKTPGYYGEEIFKMLDKLSNERVYDFLNEYGWSQFDRNADGIGDIYSNITAYLDKNSGYGLYSDLSKYFYHNGLDEACERKPIPEGMTIEQLVEEMEENEDTVECTWCNDLFDKDQCRYEVDLGWLCSRCEMAIKSRGETLTFREGSYWDFLDEELKPKTWICEFDGREIGTVEASTEEEAYAAMEREYPEYHYGLYDGVAIVYPADEDELDENVKEIHDLGNEYDGGYPAETPEVSDSHLRLCPECGKETFDIETGICVTCGFN
jgi:hypothetical protein